MATVRSSSRHGAGISEAKLGAPTSPSMRSSRSNTPTRSVMSLSPDRVEGKPGETRRQSPPPGGSTGVFLTTPLGASLRTDPLRSPPPSKPLPGPTRPTSGEGGADPEAPNTSAGETASATFAGYTVIAWMSLACLVAQNSSLTLVMRASRIRGEASDLYLASSAVVICEGLKVFASAALLAFEQGSVRGLCRVLRDDLLTDPIAANAPVLVPAGLYTLQNNLQYLAASNLDAAVFQVLYQMKLVTTALLSVVVLRRSLSWLQWLAILILTGGVCLVQMAPASASRRAGDSSFVGFVAVLTACLTSAGAGVFLERMLKTTAVSVWTRNMQLAMFGLVIGLGVTFGKDFEQVKQRGFFSGFDWVVWGVVCLQSFGGLLTAVVAKHADMIIKGFATGLAIILSCALSAVFFGFVITGKYVTGAAFVIVSVFLFSLHRAVEGHAVLLWTEHRTLVIVGVMLLLPAIAVPTMSARTMF
eukprot:TRINITY_DN8536_c0_g1_i1.p1 TRINITY_DN8536_c0_g1~~TRINITY_DN8536_c0_g1_i1.p1  ORF type:complete len:501 (+),score=94.46 TRINITY_DN8536_c0_g1_i1:82-1503(+)